MLTRRRLLAFVVLTALPLTALANNKGKKRVGGRGSSGKGGRYVGGATKTTPRKK